MQAVPVTKNVRVCEPSLQVYKLYTEESDQELLLEVLLSEVFQVYVIPLFPAANELRHMLQGMSCVICQRHTHRIRERGNSIHTPCVLPIRYDPVRSSSNALFEVLLHPPYPGGRPAGQVCPTQLIRGLGHRDRLLLGKCP